jgi:hypothetical protein
MTKADKNIEYTAYLNGSHNKLLLVDDEDFDNQWGVELDPKEYETYLENWKINKPFFIKNWKELKVVLFLSMPEIIISPIFSSSYFDEEFFNLSIDKQLQLIYAISNVLHPNIINKFSEEFSDLDLQNLWENAEILNVQRFDAWTKGK